MKLAPIVLFVYNRVEHTKRTVQALQDNFLAKDSDLFIFSDGSKDDTSAQQVGLVRDYLKTIDGFKSVHIVERNENIGLARSIISGVTDIVSRFGRIIVLEDDLVSSKYFLQFMNEALEKYEHENMVASIHGHVYPMRKPLPNTFFLKGAGCWGWATWKRAWDLFEPDGRKLQAELQKRNLLRDFDFDNSYHFSRMLEKQIQGKNNSWAIRWNASVFLKDMLTLYPGQSLIQNIGFDGSGTHSGSSDFYMTSISENKIHIGDIPVAETASARKAFVRYFNSLKPNIFVRIARKIKKLSKGALRRVPIVFSVLFKGVLSLFRSLKPKSRKFGFDRGGPIDHYYIEKFIKENSKHIHGTVLEVAESRYGRKYGRNVAKFEILHFTNDNPKATIVADLTKTETLPENFADCFICTQTFNFIYDFESAIKGARHVLKPGGVLLATVAGISQISRYDMDRWGDYWRFTVKSCEKAFREVFGNENVTVHFHGNCLMAKAFLDGRSHREFTGKELDYKDEDYQMLITIEAHKK